MPHEPNNNARRPDDGSGKPNERYGRNDHDNTSNRFWRFWDKEDGAKGM